MKILHVIPSLGVGGTEKMLLALCAGLERSRFESSVVALKSGGETMKKMEQANVPVTALNSADSLLGGALDLPRLHFRLKSAIRRSSPRILHTWLSRANVSGRLAGRGAGVPVIVSSLRVMESEKPYHLWAESLTHRFARVVTVNCTALKDFAIKKIGIPEEKVALIPNGIDLSRRADPALIQAFRERCVKKGEVVVGTLGRLHAQKGIDIFLKAARRLLLSHPNCRFLVAGQGPENQALRAMARTLAIESQVTFCGLVPESLEFLSLLDVFVLASRWEGMPNAILEAMSLGKAVVATSVGGAPDLIASGKEGVLVPPENPEALSEAVHAILSHPDFGRTLGQNAQKKVRENFSLDKMLSAYGKLYESLAQN